MPYGNQEEQDKGRQAFANWGDHAKVEENAHLFFKEGCIAKLSNFDKKHNPYEMNVIEYIGHICWEWGWENADSFSEDAYNGFIVRNNRIRDAACLNNYCEEFKAGSDTALGRAMELCQNRKLPPESWMVEAALAPLSRPSLSSTRGRHGSPSRQHSDNTLHALRFQAVAGCRYAFDNRVEVEQRKRGCGKKEAVAFVIEKHGKRPSWPEVYENAGLLLKGLGCPCTADVAKKSYAIVKRYISVNGNDSAFVKGIDTSSITVFALLMSLCGETRADWYPPPKMG